MPIRSTVGPYHDEQSLIRHDHRIYDRFAGSDNFEELMTELAQTERLAPGRLKALSQEYRVPQDTLKTWRKHLKENSEYRPKHNFRADPRRVNGQLDLAVKTRLESDYLSENRYCPKACAQEIARQIGSAQGLQNFKASSHWLL